MKKVLLALLMGVSFPAFAQQTVKNCVSGPSGASCASIMLPQVSAAVESSHIFKSTASTVVDFQVNNTSGSTVWVMVFDASTLPSAGAVTGCTGAATARPCVAKWYQVAANTTLGVSWNPGPYPSLQTGQILVCSSTGPYTLTYATSCIFSGEAM